MRVLKEDFYLLGLLQDNVAATKYQEHFFLLTEALVYCSKHKRRHKFKVFELQFLTKFKKQAIRHLIFHY